MRFAALPVGAAKSDGQLDSLEKFCDPVSIARRHADRTPYFTEIRVIGVQDRHLPPIPSIFLFRHEYLLPIQWSDSSRASDHREGVELNYWQSSQTANHPAAESSPKRV